jgi:hypothetical protein
MYRDRHDTGNYIFRDIPEAMMRELKIRAAQEGGTVRDVLLVAAANYLAHSPKK